MTNEQANAEMQYQLSKYVLQVLLDAKIITVNSTTYNDIVWKCSNRHFHNAPCTPPYIYAELLQPIFHEIIVKVLKKNSTIIRECVSTLNTLINNDFINEKDVINALENYDINPKTEAHIWRIIIEKVIVFPDYLLEFHIIDGTKIKYQMQKTSPRGNHLSDALKNQISYELSQGKKAVKIAHELSVNEGTVRSIASRIKRVTSPATPTAICQNCGKEFKLTSNPKQKILQSGVL